MKTKKTIGEMSYGDFMKESCKWAAAVYAIIGVIYGVVYLISNHKKSKAKVTDDLTTGVFIDDATEEVEED